MIARYATVNTRPSGFGVYVFSSVEMFVVVERNLGGLTGINKINFLSVLSLVDNAYQVSSVIINPEFGLITFANCKIYLRFYETHISFRLYTWQDFASIWIQHDYCPLELDYDELKNVLETIIKKR